MPTPTQPLAVFFKSVLFWPDTTGALLCRVSPVMSSPEAFLHYYYSTDTGRSAQVVVRS